VDLVFVTTRGASGEKTWLREGLSSKLVHLLDIPVLPMQVFESGAPEAPHLGRILVALDGSAFSEQILPYARLLGKQFDVVQLTDSPVFILPIIKELAISHTPSNIMK